MQPKALEFVSRPCTGKEPKLTEVCPCGDGIGELERSDGDGSAWPSGTTEKQGCADGCITSKCFFEGGVLQAAAAFGVQQQQSPPW